MLTQTNANSEKSQNMYLCFCAFEVLQKVYTQKEGIPSFFRQESLISTVDCYFC